MAYAQRRTLEVNGHAVSYLEWRPAGVSRGDVILLHGGGYDSAELSWGGFGGYLATAGWRVIAPDTPGYGQSPAPAWISTQERLVEYVKDVVDALSLDWFVLAGLSLGGGMALGYALGHHSRVRGLILLGSYGIIDRSREGLLSLPVHLLTWAMLKTGLVTYLMNRFAENADFASVEKNIRSIVRHPESRTPELIDEVLSEARRHAQGKDGFRQWQGDQFLLTRMRTNYLPLLHRLPMPSLVVNGQLDTGIPAAAAARAADVIPDSRLVIAAGAGHWVQRDAPDLVAASILDFLDELPG